jgi:tetratricopeptide (TPR) repeat protein
LVGKGRALEQLYRAQKPITEAEMLAPVQKAFELAPDDPKVATTLARMRLAYVRTEKGLDGAELCALRATKLDPADAQPFIILAQIYLARPPTPENLDKVGYYAAQAGVLDLGDPRPPYLVGRVALAQNDAPRAVKALELSLPLGPLPETVTQLAVAHRRAGNRERAEHYSRIYRDYARRLTRRDALLAERGREPGEVRHYHDLARLYLEAGQPDSASAWLERARSVSPRDKTREVLLARAQELRKQGNDAPLLSVP